MGTLTRTTCGRRAPSTPMTVSAAAMPSIAYGPTGRRTRSTTANPTTSSVERPSTVNPIHPSAGRSGPRRPRTRVAIGSPASASAPAQARTRPTPTAPAARCAPT